MTTAKKSPAKKSAVKSPRKQAQGQTEEVVEVTVTKTVKKTIRKKAAPKVVNIRFVIDRSGSMASIKNETIGGFNSFIDEQRELPGKAKVTYIQFDHVYETVYRDMDIKEVPKLNGLMYQPRGYTALYDAIGTALSEGMERSNPDEQNILVVLTDGAENSSKEYKQGDVKRLMNRAEDQGWKVLFLGANIDVAQVSSGIGMRGAAMVMPDWDKAQVNAFMAQNAGPITMSYTASGEGIGSAYRTASAVVANMRMEGSPVGASGFEGTPAFSSEGSSGHSGFYGFSGRSGHASGLSGISGFDPRY